MVDPKSLKCPACNKWHYGPCLDKTIPLTIRLEAGMLLDGDRIPDYRISVLEDAAKSYITEVRTMDAEISRLTAENASLRLAVEGAQKVIKDAPHVESCRSLALGYFSGAIGFRQKGFPYPCNCFKSHALALLPAPGEPGRLMEAVREVVAAYRRYGHLGGAYYVGSESIGVALDALCALVPPEGK